MWSRFTRLFIQRKASSISFTLSATGYGGYDITRDWNENIARKYGCGYFDILYTHYGLNKIWDEDARTPSLDCDTLLIVKGGDCGGGVQQCVRDSYLHHGNITIAR